MTASTSTAHALPAAPADQATALADLTPGFRDAVHGTQQTFRVLLDAMARPGRVRALPATALDGLLPPPAMGAGLAALLLTVLDAETEVWLAGALDAAASHAYLRFHTGVIAARTPQHTDFTATRAADLQPALWQALRAGSDEAPQEGATLLVEVDSLDPGPNALRLDLRGPGIETTQALHVQGLPREFWQWRQRQQAEMPRGIDLVLVYGTRFAALPRSTRINFS